MIDLDRLYWIIGVTVVTNLTAIGAGAYAAFRLVWWLSALNSKVEHNEQMRKSDKETIDKDLNEAHSKIRALEKRAMNGR